MQCTLPKNPTLLAASSALGFGNRHLPKLWDCGKILPQALRYIRLRKAANYDQIKVPYNITVDLYAQLAFSLSPTECRYSSWPINVCVLLVVQRTVSAEVQLGTSTFHPSNRQVRYQDVVDSNCTRHRSTDDVTRRDVTFHSRQQSSTVQQQGLPG